MIHEKNSALQYLYDYKNGKIKMGLDTGTRLDKFLRFKYSQLNIILGHDNVGKTYWIMWYFLVLSVKHNIKFCIWSGENKHGQLLRDMMQMLSGKKVTDLRNTEIITLLGFLESRFTFVDNIKLYKPAELLQIFADTDCDVGLIDPYTGLDRGMKWEDNYRFLNEARQFCNKTGKTIYINSHPNTESGRTGMLYPKGSDFEGHLMPPLKDHIEGGKAFLNRCDDMLVIHRLIKHEEMKYITMVNVEKVKDMETGGSITGKDDSVLFNWNSGFGFTVGFQDALEPYRELAEVDKHITDLEKQLISSNLKLDI